MTGALMWVLYGLLIEAYPVVVANLLVFGAAAWTITRSRDILRSQRLRRPDGTAETTP
jgi:hypothetical protein